MQVRLTKEGQKVLGFSPDRKIANVSDDRAFALMSGGYANQDKGFMALFDGPLPEKPKPDTKPDPDKLTAEDKQKLIDKQFKKDEKKETARLKKEKADSKKAGQREKAVKK